jgi:Glycosyltransferase family 87
VVHNGSRQLFAAVTLALLGVAILLALRGNVERQSFKAFYCAGAAVKERADPYTVEPLRSCERRLSPSSLPDGYVEPAPLPGYAVAPFAALATIPPKPASALFAILLVLAAATSAYALAPLLPAPPAAVLLAFAPLTLLNVAYGEIVPFALAAICVAAALIRHQRWFGAGLAVSAALLQPNVGLAAVAAVFIFCPRSRWAIALATASFAALSLLAVGMRGNVEYVTHLLPGMASAEIAAADQYSLSHALYVAGVAAPLALALGKIWFGVAAALGVILAGVLALRRSQPTLVPLVPPACVLLFGIYLHDIQMLLALPAALVVGTRVEGTAARTAAVVAVALLAAVWTQRAGAAVLAIDALGVAGATYAIVALKDRWTVSLVTTVATIAAMLVLQHLQPPLVAANVVTSDFHAAARDWASDAWAAYLRATPALTGPSLLLKLPTWLGMLLVVAAALRLSLPQARWRAGAAGDATPTLS